MILKVGDSNLRKVEFEDSDIDSSAFQDDLKKLIHALREYGGMGIAAPQMDIQRRLLLIESKPNSRYPYAPLIDLMVLVNPLILEKSTNEEFGWEACLSVPGKRVSISRSVFVRVAYEDQFGFKCECKLEGFAARVFLHEYDHLEGLTILDRAVSTSHIVSEEEYFNKILPLQN